MVQQRIPLRGEVQMFVEGEGLAQTSHMAVLLPDTVPAKVLPIPGHGIERTPVLSTVVLSQWPEHDLLVTPKQARRLIQGLPAAAKRIKDGKPVVLELVKGIAKLLPEG